MANHQARIPMYVKIEQYIRQKIADADYLPGKAIPSERELTERFQVSRMTVRQAIMILVQEGLLVREKGRGTFVRLDEVQSSIGALTTFTEEMAQQGYDAHSEVVSFSEQAPSVEMQQSLQLPIAASVYKVERLCFVNDEPIAFECAYIPISLFPMLTVQDVKRSFYTFAEQQLHEKISIATQHVEAALADETDCEQLIIEAGAPILRIHRLTKMTSGKPIEWMKRTYRADRYTFKTTITR